MTNQPMFEFRQVPPPATPLIDDEAERLLMVPGLRVEGYDRQYRCACCGNMQRAGSKMVWVPDGVRKGDPAWSVSEAARIGAYNGSRSGWCVSCAQSFSNISAAERLAAKAVGGDPRNGSLLVTLLVLVALIGIYAILELVK